MTVEGHDSMHGDGNDQRPSFGSGVDGAQPAISEDGVVPSGRSADRSDGSEVVVVPSSPGVPLDGLDPVQRGAVLNVLSRRDAAFPSLSKKQRAAGADHEVAADRLGDPDVAEPEAVALRKVMEGSDHVIKGHRPLTPGERAKRGVLVGVTALGLSGYAGMHAIDDAFSVPESLFEGGISAVDDTATDAEVSAGISAGSLALGVIGEIFVFAGVRPVQRIKSIRGAQQRDAGWRDLEKLGRTREGLQNRYRQQRRDGRRG